MSNALDFTLLLVVSITTCDGGCGTASVEDCMEEDESCV